MLRLTFRKWLAALFTTAVILWINFDSWRNESIEEAEEEVHHGAHRPIQQSSLPIGQAEAQNEVEESLIQRIWGAKHPILDKPSTESISTNIKILIYVLPHFYTIPEDDQLPGWKFIDWTNIKATKKNTLEIEVMKPGKDIGFYDMLDIETRKRQGQYLRDIGTDGIIFQYHWIKQGAALNQVLAARLMDNEPDISFMLSWDCEPWAMNNKDDESAAVQPFGDVKEWREHFEWLLPYFNHPYYIKNNGRLQFAILRGWHLDAHFVGTPMFAAWQIWAAEAGFTGLDIIDTNLQGEPLLKSASASIDFPFKLRFDPDDQDTVSYNGTAITHRGSILSWDSTPTRTSGTNQIYPYAHPELFERQLKRELEHIARTPNPPEYDNYLVIRSLNDWEHGCALEPSQLWDDGFGIAVKNAQAHRKELQSLTKHLSLALANEQEDSPWASICILVATVNDYGPHKVLNLEHTLESLVELENRNWKAFVFEGNPVRDNYIEKVTIAQSDPRIQHIRIENARTQATDGDAVAKAIEWIVAQKNVNACTDQDFILFTTGDTIYRPQALSFKDTGETDVFVLSSDQASKAAQAFIKAKSGEEPPTKHAEMCVRFESDTSCPNPLDNLDLYDYRALLIRSTTIQKSNFRFPTKSQQLHFKEMREENHWVIKAKPSTECEVWHPQARSSCRHYAGIFLDSNKPLEIGCYTPTELRGLRDMVDPKPSGPIDSGSFDTIYDFDAFHNNPFCIRHTKEIFDARAPESFKEMREKTRLNHPI